ncbi:Hypothetical predicted protein [Cloeon dipterum]|uniref:Chitin-binding type-2 domain-containing protein n=1 Tax=Cloeon dipterum TaxID=197152 RepID=A0A8S1DBQ6_9INSE|nr:Hypothetical predicted protein [Cloeon dipterum]
MGVLNTILGLALVSLVRKASGIAYANFKSDMYCDPVRCFNSDGSQKPFGEIVRADTCDGYCVCLADATRLMKCPDSLVFNEHLKVCDYPERVKCSLDFRSEKSQQEFERQHPGLIRSQGYDVNQWRQLWNCANSAKEVNPETQSNSGPQSNSGSQTIVVDCKAIPPGPPPNPSDDENNCKMVIPQGTDCAGQNEALSKIYCAIKSYLKCDRMHHPDPKEPVIRHPAPPSRIRTPTTPHLLHNDGCAFDDYPCYHDCSSCSFDDCGRPRLFPAELRQLPGCRVTCTPCPNHDYGCAFDNCSPCSDHDCPS